MLEILPSFLLSLTLGLTGNLLGISPTPTITPNHTIEKASIHQETANVDTNIDRSSVNTPSPLITPEQNQSKFKIGLQIGHWMNHELPDELAILRRNDGAHAGGKQEEEVNIAIVRETAKLLEKDGVDVEILPATIPPGYKADAFISIHADGNPNPEKAGYKMSTSIGDRSGKGEKLVKLLEEEYDLATKLTYDPYITDNMREYYAFAYWKFEHSIDPSTPSAIVETGYLTNTSDREVIVKNPQRPAEGIAKAISRFLEED